LGAKATFDSVTRIITIIEPPDGNGEILINVKQDLYSDGKEDWRSSEALRRVRFPLRAAGGDALPGAIDSGTTFFLRSDWRILPYNADHKLIVEGDLFREDGGALFLPTADPHTVQIESRVSALVYVAEGSGSGSSLTKQDVEDAVWDAILTGAHHNTINSAGRKLRQLASPVIHEGTSAGPGENGNQIILDAGASGLDGAYDPALITLTDGTGAGQSRLILQYTGSERRATVDRDWKVNPDATTEFLIIADPGREHVNEGLIQGGTADTAILNDLAVAGNDEYVGQIIFIRSGTGADQARLVTGYIGATRTATVQRPWHVIPDTTSAYVMIPAGICPLDTLVEAILGQPLAAIAATSPGSLAEAAAADYKLNHHKNWIDAANSQLVVYEADGVTEWKRYNLLDAGGAPADGAVYGREPAP